MGSFRNTAVTAAGNRLNDRNDTFAFRKNISGVHSLRSFIKPFNIPYAQDLHAAATAADFQRKVFEHLCRQFFHDKCLS